MPYVNYTRKKELNLSNYAFGIDGERLMTGRIYVKIPKFFKNYKKEFSQPSTKGLK